MSATNVSESEGVGCIIGQHEWRNVVLADQLLGCFNTKDSLACPVFSSSHATIATIQSKELVQVVRLARRGNFRSVDSQIT